MGNLKQFFIRADYLTLAVRRGEEHLEKGGSGRKSMVSTSHQDVLPQPVLIHRKTRHHVGFLGRGPCGWTASSVSLSRDQASTHRQNLSLGSRIDPREPPWSVVIATWWITEEIGFLQTSTYMWLFVASALWQWIVLLTERILICSATPHFSTRSSLTILMRVFFQETHISLFDLGASVRIFFNTTLAFWKC